jgi:hypothetical protein
VKNIKSITDCDLINKMSRNSEEGEADDKPITNKQIELIKFINYIINISNQSTSPKLSIANADD